MNKEFSIEDACKHLTEEQRQHIEKLVVKSKEEGATFLDVMAPWQWVTNFQMYNIERQIENEILWKTQEI